MMHQQQTQAAQVEVVVDSGSAAKGSDTSPMLDPRQRELQEKIQQLNLLKL